MLSPSPPAVLCSDGLGEDRQWKEVPPWWLCMGVARPWWLCKGVARPWWLCMAVPRPWWLWPRCRCSKSAWRASESRCRELLARSRWRMEPSPWCDPEERNPGYCDTSAKLSIHSLSRSAAEMGAAVVAMRRRDCEREMSKLMSGSEATSWAILWNMT